LYFVTTTGTLLSQESEQELKETADKLFFDEKYIEAKPYVERLLALQPRSFDYQFKYGTCLLYNGYKKTDAFKYLQYSVTDPNINVAAYFFLGKAYHLTYNFNEAIKNYNLYKQKAGNNINPKYEVDRQVAMCQNGKALLSGLTEIVVLEKKEYSSAEFFRIYDLKNIGGQILVGYDFQSKIDKKKNYVPLIHFPATSKVIYYASYGETDKGNKDIYYCTREGEGWSKPTLVPGAVNTTSDEDFPYMHPDGEHLYFSSKGHNSMGGYDIFMATKGTAGSFGSVENVDFAISSADNDMFYIVDSLNQRACFASARQANNGKMFIYTVKVDRMTMKTAVIKGDFASSIKPENKKINIVVKDAKSNRTIGSFNTDNRGNYLITLPQAGNYIYEMKVEGSSIVHKYDFTVPPSEEFRPLKQHIQEDLADASTSSATKEKVTVTDKFNEAFDDPSAILAEVIQQKAELNVNVQNFTEEQLNPSNKTGAVAILGLNGKTPAQQAAIVADLSETQEDKLKGTQKLVDGAKVNALKALEEADQKQQLAKQLVAKSANETPEEKYKLLKEAQSILDQANASKDEAKMLLKFADSITPAIAVEQKKYDELKTLSEAVSQAGVNGDEAKIASLVEEKVELIKETKTANAANPIQPVIDEKKKVVAQENKLEQDISSYKESEKRITKEIATLKEELAEAKTKDKPAIESKIASKEQELGMVKDEIAYQEKKMDELKAVEKTLDAKLKFLQDINNTTIASAPTSEAVKQKLNEVDSKNSRSMSDYVDQQVTELEKNAAIAAIKENPTNTELTTAIDKEWSEIQKVLDERKNEEASLNESGNLSEQEKAQVRVDNDKKAISEIEETQKALEALLAKAPENTSIKAKIAELEKEKTSTEQHLKEQEKIAEGQATTAVVRTPETETATIYPSYQAEKSAVKEANPLDQLIGLNKVDKKLLDKTTAELTKVEGQLADDPTNKGLSERKAVLETLRKQTETNISSREKAITSMSGSETANLSNEKLIKQLSPSYEEKKNAITTDDKRTELEERNELDQELLFTITAEKNKIAEQLKTNPTDKGLNDRKNALQSLETKIKNDIAVREGEMEKLPEATVQSNPDKELAIVEPDYQRKLDAIDKSTPKTELEGRIDLNSAVLGSAKDELGQINESLASQPENKTLLSRKEAVNQLITKLEGEVASDKADLEKLNVPVVDASANLKKEIRPEYEANLAKIEVSDKPEEEKQLAKIKEEQALLTSINDEIKATDKLLVKTPEDQKLQDKKAELTELQAIQETALQEKQEELVAIERAKIEPIDLQKEIAPKFTIPAESALGTQNTETQKELETAEQQLRATLVKKQQANEKALAKGFDPKLVAENRVISVLMERSVERENRIGEITPEVNPRELLVKELTPEQNESLTQKPNSKEQSQEYRAILEELQQDLMKQADSPQLSAEERGIKRSQSVVIQQRLNELNAIDQTFNDVASTNKNPEASTNPATSELAKLDNREEKIKSQLKTATPKEQKQLQKELTAIEAKKEVVRDSLNTTAIKEIQKDQKEVIANLPQDNEVVKVLTERTTDPTTDKETQRIEEQKKLSLAQAVSTAATAQENFENENVVTASPEALAKAKRRYTIEIGDLSAERAALGNSPQDEIRKTQIDKEVSTFNKAIEVIEEMEKAQSANVVETPLAKEGLDVEVSAEKENEIRSNPDYQKALVQQQELTQVIQQRKGITKDIAAEQAKFDNGDPTASVEKLKELKAEDENLKQEQDRLESVLRSEFTAKGTDADAWKNVVSREMPYIKPQVSTEELAPFVAEGFKINQPNENVKPVLNKDLPIGIKMPSGLVYRVQVGAFAKPVPEELFKEFTPVTGEKLNNGITRYMAGFFGDRTKVLDAQKNIRALGYTDAFVVAYCDGERITLAEARRLEDAGLCVPKEQNEIAIEVTQNVIAQLPQDSLRPAIKEIKPGDYNKADGAAVAMAVEEKLGLFYTVQVGVYNKPVPATQLKNIDPLVTKRLPNGQIRYSSGVFQSVSSALPKKKEAIALGITDAFVTAYYKGERISLEEARRILKENGTSVLEPLETPVQPAKIDNQVAEAIKEEQRTASTPASNAKATLVSTATYPTYPEKEIQLLNTTGTFYYDSLDQKIKSATYSSVGALPELANLPVSFDTLQIGKIEAAITQNEEFAEIAFNESVSGALANYLLRGNIPFEMITGSETNTPKLRIYAGKTGNFDVILNQLQLLGVSAEVQNGE